jgi:uncharacterized membrane protein YoaK (UPF0700 family)
MHLVVTYSRPMKTFFTFGENLFWNQSLAGWLSRAMDRNIPLWLWLAVAPLSWVAGGVNVVGLLEVSPLAITQMTGITSSLAIDTISPDPHSEIYWATLLSAFVGGCVLSGLLVDAGHPQLERRFTLLLLLQSLMLLVATQLLIDGERVGLYLAAGVCGLQNGVVTICSRSLFRTTHLSGMLTDVGVFVGQRLRRSPTDDRRFGRSLLVIASFFAGGLFGALTFQSMKCQCLLWMVIVLAVVSGCHAVALHLRSRRPDEATKKAPA